MRKLALTALPILLLLAVAAPSCLAAENSASDPQPVSQYNKLPPVQLPRSLYAQKTESHISSFSLQKTPIQTNKEEHSDWIGITTAIGTIISSIAAVITAIAVPIITLNISKKTMKQTASSLEEDFNRRKIEQETSFKFQRDQILFEEKKKVMFNFFESTSLPSIRAKDFSLDSLRVQLSMIELLLGGTFYKMAHKVFTYINSDQNLVALQYRGSTPFYLNRDVITEHKYLHSDLANEIKKNLRCAEFDPVLTASK